MDTKYFLSLIILSFALHLHSQTKPVKIPDPISFTEQIKYTEKLHNDIRTSHQSTRFDPVRTSTGFFQFMPTGIFTVLDFQSNAVTQQIWQDPLVPSNVHAVCMYSQVPGFEVRFCAYLFSINSGETFDYLGNIPGTGRSGFPVISGFSNGAAVVSAQTTTNGTTERTKIYYDAGPGFGVFAEIDPGLFNNEDPLWPRIAAIGDNKVAFSSSTLFPQFLSATNVSTNITPPGTFSGYQQYSGQNAECYFMAMSVSGTIGYAYLGDSTHFGCAFYKNSTDQGLSWSSPIEIWHRNLTDSIGILRGISMTFRYNSPVVVFNTSKLGSGIYFPEEPSQIRVWNPDINGGIPVIAVDSNDVPFHPNLSRVQDAFLPLCRPAVGRTGDGSYLAMIFSATTGQYQDSNSYYSCWVAFSGNGGASWSKERVTPSTPLRDWRFPSISQINSVAGGSVL